MWHCRAIWNKSETLPYLAALACAAETPKFPTPAYTEGKSASDHASKLHVLLECVLKKESAASDKRGSVHITTATEPCMLYAYYTPVPVG